MYNHAPDSAFKRKHIHLPALTLTTLHPPTPHPAPSYSPFSVLTMITTPRRFAVRSETEGATAAAPPPPSAGREAGQCCR